MFEGCLSGRDQLFTDRTFLEPRIHNKPGIRTKRGPFLLRVVCNEGADLNSHYHLSGRKARSFLRIVAVGFLPYGSGYLAKRAELTVMGIQPEKSMAYTPNLLTVEASSLIMYKHNNEVTLKGERVQAYPSSMAPVRVEPFIKCNFPAPS